MPESNPQPAKSETYQGGLCITTLYCEFLRYLDAQQSLKLMLERIIENTIDAKFKTKNSPVLGCRRDFQCLRNAVQSGTKFIQGT